MASQRTLTVRDLMRTALPIGTRVVAGANGLGRTVSWTSVLHTRPPAFPSLESHELALLSLDALHLLNDKLTLAELISQLVGMEVSAIGVLGNIDGRARAAAESHNLPLLNIPEGLSLRQVERDVVKVLMGPPPTADQRGLEIHEQLLMLSTENRGMEALAAAIADATGKTVVVQDKRFDVVAAEGAIRSLDIWSMVERALSQEHSLPPTFLDRVGVAQQSPEPAILDLPDLGLKRVVVPIVANRMGRGFFSLITNERGFDALDVQFARHGAAVCALEMAKEKAVREAKKQVQGGVLDRLLGGTMPADQALRQLIRLGHNPEEHAYAALVARWTRDSGPSERRLETMFNEQVSTRGIDALVQLVQDGLVVVFCIADTEEKLHQHRKSAPRVVRQLADSIMERARAQFPETPLAIGIGRPVRTISEWRGSHQEALAAERMALQWNVETPLFFGDLGVYRLLSLLLETPELRSFYRETLGELASERYANEEFIKTLETFFEEDGNLSKTAQKLSVHRNTLLYRMERIGQIGSFDLENPETRLAVHLALKIRRLLTGQNVRG
jgi:PucR family transcriptional regulator, purine catabolism regulatory protein